VQYLHTGAMPVDKDEYIPILDVSSHLIGHYSAQGVKTPAHICGIRIQKVSHRRGKAEHVIGAFDPTGSGSFPYPGTC